MTVGAAVGVGDCEGDGAGGDEISKDWDGEGEGDWDGDGEGEGEGEGDAVTTTFGFLIATPLLQTNFFPDLIQVYFFPVTILVIPADGQVVPGLIAAREGEEKEVMKTIREIESRNPFFTL